jgi:hypothetical protein
MNGSRWIELNLASSALAHPISMRLCDHGERWTAVVRCGPTTTNGLGTTAREALVAAMAPFGMHATATLMAEPAMFAASADLLAMPAVG